MSNYGETAAQLDAERLLERSKRMESHGKSEAAEKLSMEARVEAANAPREMPSTLENIFDTKTAPEPTAKEMSSLATEFALDVFALLDPHSAQGVLLLKSYDRLKKAIERLNPPLPPAAASDKE